jgi:hypothetical protein
MFEFEHLFERMCQALCDLKKGGKLFSISATLIIEKATRPGKHKIAQHQLVMTAPRDRTNQHLSHELLHTNKYFRAINNKHGLRQDMEAMCKFIRETLFYAMIHDTNGSGTNTSNDIMGENGKACQVFVHVFLKDKDKISNVELVDSNQEEKIQYLKFLWKEGLQVKAKYNIRKALSNEKSAVYAGISESFKSKLVKEM